MRLHRKAAIFITLLLVIGWMFWNAGYFVSTPSQTPEKAEVIVALGGDSGNRVKEAARLHTEGFAPYILLTGVEYGDSSTRPAYLNWRAAYLVEQGISRDAVLLDNSSSNSWEEAQNTSLLMKQKGWHHVIVVSDPPHMRRLSWVWGKVFKGSGLEYQLVAAPMKGWDASHWWNNEKSAQFVLMELIKLAYYLVRH